MPAGQSYLSDDGSGVHNRTAETFPIDLPLRECCARVNSCDRRVRSDGDGLGVSRRHLSWPVTVSVRQSFGIVG